MVRRLMVISGQNLSSSVVFIYPRTKSEIYPVSSVVWSLFVPKVDGNKTKSTKLVDPTVLGDQSVIYACLDTQTSVFFFDWR